MRKLSNFCILLGGVENDQFSDLYFSLTKQKKHHLFSNLPIFLMMQIVFTRLEENAECYFNDEVGKQTATQDLVVENSQCSDIMIAEKPSANQSIVLYPGLKIEDTFLLVYHFRARNGKLYRL